MDVLYKYGKKIILESEVAPEGHKSSEGFLEDVSFDIKGIEGTSERNILRKMYETSEKKAKILLLYYHDNDLFNKQKIIDGYRSYLRNSKSKNVESIYYILDNKLFEL